MKQWRLFLPDWEHLDTVWRSPLPFVLWRVAEQPLLYHWLDYAVNQGIDSLTLYGADRPAEVREALERATLWQLEWQLWPLAEGGRGKQFDDIVNRLPWQDPLAAEPEPGWGLIEHLRELENTWYGYFRDELQRFGTNLAVGRFSRIDPTVRIEQPVWIGDFVYVGPQCEIGPNVTIGDGCVLQGNSRLVDSHVSSHTYLGQHTELLQCVLDGGLLLNLRNRARVVLGQGFVADRLEYSGQRDRNRPGWRERLLAFLLWVWFRLRAGPAHYGPEVPATVTPGGLTLKVAEGKEIWRQRQDWFLAVARGRMRLFGILPRSTEAIEQVPEDWREMIAACPSGVVSLADARGCHSPDDPSELVHAVYQSCLFDEMEPILRRLLRRWIFAPIRF